MTRQEAVRVVARQCAAILSASTLDEATGIPEDDISPADEARLGEAVSTVLDRLYRMGGTG